MSETTNYINYVPYDMLMSEVSKDKVYRDTNVLENVFQLIRYMHQTILNTSGDYRGFWFILLYPVLMILGVIPRSLFYIVRELSKPCFNYKEHFRFDNNSNTEDSLVNIKIREISNTITDNYTPNREEKINKANNINILRKQIYTNNMELRGNLVSDNLVTFGNEINEVLSNLFSKEVELKISFLSRGNCVIVKNINSLENEISKLLHVDVKIILN